MIETDWKSNNDSLATLDTTSGLEWLDLSYTKGRSYKDFSEGVYQDLDNWRVPTLAELEDYFNNSMSVTMSGPGPKLFKASDSNDFDAGVNEISQWHSLMGATNGSWSTGVFKDGNDLRYFGVDVNQNIIFSPYDKNVINHWYDNGHSSTGIYLVSDGGTTLSSINDPSINIVSAENVPVPATALLLVAGLLGFSARRKSA